MLVVRSDPAVALGVPSQDLRHLRGLLAGVGWTRLVNDQERIAALEAEVLELRALLQQGAWVVEWGDQCHEGIEKTAGGKWWRPRADAFYEARMQYLVSRNIPLSPPWGSLYHEAAAAQPWNHRIPWNCPDYYDGCNCPGGPFYDPPEVDHE